MLCMGFLLVDGLVDFPCGDAPALALAINQL
jgi:hypothetical protein